ncbi:MAG: PAS domain S-box protein, partial [Armatimonadetes bacterium]|nr:PAS domain S-box protein [Armatimonadota bacterium]
MTTPLRVLVAGHSPEDAAPLLDELRRAGFSPAACHADTDARFLAVLTSGFDIILAADSPPHVDGCRALRLLRERGLEVPLIVVADDPGGDREVECLRAGAADCVRKDQRARLGPAVALALERRRARQSSDREWQATFDSISDAIVLMDLSGTILKANRAMERLLGKGALEILGRRCYEVVHGIGSPIRGCPLQGMCRSRSRETKTLEMQGRWYHVVVDPVLDERGNLVAGAHIATDVTDQKRAQDNLARLAAIVDSSQDAIISTDLAGTILDWNSGAERLYGYRAEEVRGRPFAVILPPDRQDEMARNLARVQRGEVIANYETARLARDGRLLTVAVTVSPIYEVSGNLVGVSSIGHDVTESREAQARIHFQASLLNQVRNAVIASDTEGRITFWNKHAERLYQWRDEEVCGRPVQEVTVSRGALDATAARIAVVAETGYWEGEVEARRKDGSVFPAYVVETPLKDEAGATVGYVGVSTDISERKHLEEEFRQAQKMEAVGRLAGGVAHDFNNILMPILAYGQMLMERLPEDDRTRRYAEQIVKAAERATALPRHLLAFSRKQVLQPRVLDLNTVVRDVEKMLRRLIGEDVDLVLSLDPELGQVQADPGQIEQVLLNLAVNARDAMPEGGRLLVTTANTEVPAAGAGARSAVAPGRWVVLTVSDTGVGMDRATQARIFEPFFTTK